MPLRICIIDDYEPVRDAVALILETAGYAALRAGDAEHALELIADGRAEVALTDWHMPDVGGDSFVTTLRRRFPQLPIVVMSGGGIESIAEDALRLGADQYIAKPFRPSEILAAIQTAAARRG